MACRFEVTLFAADARHIDAALAALDEAGRIEAVLTVFRESSDLSRINSHAGHRIWNSSHCEMPL